MGRSTRRPVADPGAALGPEAGPTFGEELARLGLITQAAAATRQIIDEFGQAAVEHTRARLAVITCYGCDAAKACCSEPTSAYLYEAVPIAERLLRDGRDTPALRAELKQAAHAIETTRRGEYFRPCVLLGPGERCTVYDVRPSVCGTHLVETPPANCSKRNHELVGRIIGPLKDSRQPGLEQLFTMTLGLRPLATGYLAAMPRMVLLCLEAWPRRDYVTYLAERVLPAAHRLSAVLR